MAQKRARSRSQVPRTFSALLSLLLVTQAAPPNAPLNLSPAPLYPHSPPLSAFSYCDGWPQLPAESATAEDRNDVSGAAPNPNPDPKPSPVPSPNPNPNYSPLTPTLPKGAGAARRRGAEEVVAQGLARSVTVQEALTLTLTLA